MITLFIILWIITRVAGERGWLLFKEQIILFIWFLSSLLRSPFCELSYGTQIFSCFFHSVNSIHISLPQISLSPIFQPCAFKIPDHPAKPFATATDWFYLIISPSKQVNSHVHCSKFCPLRVVSLRHSSSGMFQKGNIRCSCPLWGSASILGRTKCESGPSLSSSAKWL